MACDDIRIHVSNTEKRGFFAWIPISICISLFGSCTYNCICCPNFLIAHNINGGSRVPKSRHLNKTFHVIIEQMIDTGQAPNYTEIAVELGVSPSEGREVLRQLFSTRGFPGWFFPKTDNIASFAPFNNSPNNYRLTIDGEQKWFGQ